MMISPKDFFSFSQLFFLLQHVFRMKLVNLITPMTFAERAIYVTLHIIVFITSLVGDSIILIGTIKYKAIKQHKVIVAVIKHLAVIDILASLLYVLPKTATLITDRWDLSGFLCSAYTYFWCFFTIATPLLTCALPILKLVILKYPLRAISWSSRVGNTVCVILTLCSIVLNSPLVIADIFYVADDGVYFTNLFYACVRSYRPAVKHIVLYLVISVVVICLVFSVAMIAASLALIIIAKKSAARFRESIKWEGVATILATVVVFVITNMPLLVQGLRFNDIPTYSIHDFRFSQFAVHLLTLNIMSNFFIYCLTIRSFREFLRQETSEILLRSVHPVRRPALTSPMQIIELQQRNVDKAKD